MSRTTNFDAVEEIGIKLGSLNNAFDCLQSALELDHRSGLNGYIVPNKPEGFTDSSFYPNHHPWHAGIPEPHLAALSAYKQIRFVDGQDPKETLRYPGIIAVSAETIEAAKVVNKIKKDLQAYIVGLKTSATSQYKDYGEKKRDSLIAEALNPAGHGRICLKQLYRPICIADGEVLWARFFMDPRQSVRPTDVNSLINEACRLFEATNDIGYDFVARSLMEAVDMAKAEGREIHFAKVGSPADIICANLKFVEKPEMRAKKHTAVMPVMYLRGNEPGLEVTTGDLLPRIASNEHTKILNEPFSKLMRIHQYLPGVTPKPRSTK